jgi:hypothetical protein
MGVATFYQVSNGQMTIGKRVKGYTSSLYMFYPNKRAVTISLMSTDQVTNRLNNEVK